MKNVKFASLALGLAAVAGLAAQANPMDPISTMRAWEKSSSSAGQRKTSTTVKERARSKSASKERRRQAKQRKGK